jgi:hypothetical protein
LGVNGIPLYWHFTLVVDSIASVSQAETRHNKRQGIGDENYHDYTLLSTDFEIVYFYTFISYTDFIL